MFVITLNDVKKAIIRRIVQRCFDKTIEELKNDNLIEEAESLGEAKLEWFFKRGKNKGCHKHYIKL